MIIEIKEGATFYSEVKMPAKKWLVEEMMNCECTTDRKENIMILKVISKLIFADFYSKEQHEIFRSQTEYELITDGRMTVEELYQVFARSMIIMINGFNALEKHSGYPENKTIHPIPIETLRAYLQLLVDDFGSR